MPVSLDDIDFNTPESVTDADLIQFLADNYERIKDLIQANIDSIQANTDLIAALDLSGNGCNAGLLDGIDSLNFLRSNVADTVNGKLTIADTPILNHAIYLRGKNNVGTILNLLGITTTTWRAGVNGILAGVLAATGSIFFETSAVTQGSIGKGSADGDFRISPFGSNGDLEINCNGTGVINFLNAVSTIARVNSNGRILVDSGVVGTPGFTFLNDSNTGFWNPSADILAISLGGSELARFDEGIMISTTTAVKSDTTGFGTFLKDDGSIEAKVDVTSAAIFVNSTVAGTTHNYIQFRVRGSNIGDIDTVDDTTVRYNTFTGAHYSQLQGHSDLSVVPKIAIGTVCSSVDELNEYYIVEWDVFETPAEASIRTKNEWLPIAPTKVKTFYTDIVLSDLAPNEWEDVHTKQVQEEKDYQELLKTEFAKQTITAKFVKKNQARVVGIETIGNVISYITEDKKTINATVIKTSETLNKRLPKFKVSDVIQDANVYGIYAAYYKDDQKQGECSIEALGSGLIRITGVCKAGDLIESRGDGTGQVQSDDIVHSYTICKLRGSKPLAGAADENLLPCTLLCG